MGVWGTGIYSNDTAEDVRDICRTIFPFVSIDEGNRIIFREFQEIIDSDCVDNDYASFWYALADWQWKHGILSEDIRQKALELTKTYAGLSEWKESGSNSDVKKRIAVLEKLRTQLESTMPVMHLPKQRLAKPKHKIGDIIIFKTCSKGEDEYDTWSIENLTPPFMFKNPLISNSPPVLTPIFDAHEKYMAILCVGTEKVLYSQYLPGLYDENSVYVYYDYVSSKKPTIEVLQQTGFLPQISWSWSDFNKNLTEYIDWSYSFTLSSESFCSSRNSGLHAIERIHDVGESERYHALRKGKSYRDDIKEYFDLFNAFASCWCEIKRMERLGLEIDTLVSTAILNPEFLQPTEVDAAYEKWSNALPKFPE